MHSRHITFNRDSFDYSDIGGPLSHSSMAQSELLELVDIPQFHESEEASEVVPDSQNGSGANSQNDSQAEDISQQQSGSSPQDAPSHPSPNPQNIAPPHEIIDQSHSPNDVDSPNSSFHFPANVPNVDSQQGIAQQQHPPIVPVSPPSQNISASNESDVQQENNPTFDGARRSTRVRAQAPHPDAEYFSTLEAEKQAKSNLATLQQDAEHFRKLELERQAYSAIAETDLVCLLAQAEETKHTMEEAQHQDMLLSTNLETLIAYTESMNKFQCHFATLGEKPNTAHMNLAHALTVKATKDTPWKTLLKRHPERAPEAIAKELASLEKNILERLDENHPEYQTALKEACSGRLIGTVKRSDELKARGVKQGFKENISVTDGPNFNYYSHVAKMASVRTLLMRRSRRGGRRIAIKDVATAFLQSHKYPPGAPRKYIYFKHPITGETMYYRQHAPIYGENSAPIHWENTLFPFLTNGKKDILDTALQALVLEG